MAAVIFVRVPKLIIDFEQAATLRELSVKARRRVARGWVAASEPRQFDIRIAPDFLEPRYSQTFQKLIPERRAGGS